jgi:crossover junction endodeoxyribonuclease RuvC
VLKQFVTGKGTSPKELVMMNVFKRWGYEAATNNLADAYTLAAMGLAHANRLRGLTEAQRKIVGGLKIMTS